MSLSVLDGRRGASAAGGAPPVHRERDRLKGALPFVVAGERDRGKVHRPDAIVDLLQGDPFAGKGAGDEEPRSRPRNIAVGCDEAHFHVPGIIDRRHAPRARTERRGIARGGRLLRERFMGPLLVVLPHKSPEAVLLPCSSAPAAASFRLSAPDEIAHATRSARGGPARCVPE